MDDKDLDMKVSVGFSKGTVEMTVILNDKSLPLHMDPKAALILAETLIHASRNAME